MTVLMLYTLGSTTAAVASIGCTKFINIGVLERPACCSRVFFRIYFFCLYDDQVRNPEYPERTIGTHSSVTSLDFSERHPTLLAVGMYDGTTAIYDTAREGEVREATGFRGKEVQQWAIELACGQTRTNC